MTDEQDRLGFVEKRDGHEAMLRFAEQTLFIYLMWSIDPKNSRFGESIEQLKKVLEENGKTIKFLIVDDKEVTVESLGLKKGKL